MFETSRDILNWVLAVSIGVLAFFLCWALYYFIASAQRIFKLVKQIERGVSKAEELIDFIQQKISGSASYMVVIGELIKRGMEFAKNRRGQNGYDEDDDEVVVKKKKKK
ncbi:MAG: hypothetical protein Q8Q67_01325 [bacterium]|nr:hypothetical protein [bacterium]